MKKIRVLQTSKLYAPYIGGVEQVVQDIAEGLAARTDMTVLVCRDKGGRADERYNGVRVARCASLGIKFSMPISLSYISEFRRFAKDADIVHLHVPFPLGDLAVFLSGYKGKLAVWWHSDIIRQKKLLVLLTPLIHRVLARADVIFASSENLIKYSAFLPKFSEKCVVVPFGVDLAEYDKISNGDFLTKRLYNKDSKKALFVGRLVYYKGAEVLVRAFAGTFGAELFIVGGGELENELKDIAAENGDKFHFLGHLPYEDLQRAYKDCDFFVFPSVADSEAFGLVQMSAMSCGKPVINTELRTGVPFVSVGGVTGITVAPYDTNALRDAVQTLTDDDDLRQTYGKNARERVEKMFTKTKMLDDIFEKYCELGGRE
ncbi:glycosyl transferase family 1 [Clostridia bacterium]|nr:glycosyl transferase family 1 [Clostridia bacterium]